MTETNRRYLAPCDGGRVRVRKQDGSILPPDGDWVVFDTYFQRLLAFGDVEERDPPAEPAAPAAATKGADK